MKKKLFCILAILLLTAASTSAAVSGVNPIAESSLQSTANDITDDEGTLHFLPLGQGDAVILESRGKYALVDFAPLNMNWSYNLGAARPIEYLKEIAGDENGKVHLEFALMTHMHMDHVMAFVYLVQDPDITIDTVYMKRVYGSRWILFETIVDHVGMYRMIRRACLDRGFNHVQDISSDSFMFGDFEVKILNSEYDMREDVLLSENDNSMGTLLSIGGKRIYIPGDLNNYSGDEDRLAPVIGKLDLFRAGHHGFEDSNTQNFLDIVRPEYIVVPNHQNSDNAAVRARMQAAAKGVYYTGAFGSETSGCGVIKAIISNGELSFEFERPPQQ